MSFARNQKGNVPARLLARTRTQAVQTQIENRVRRTAEHYAASASATRHTRNGKLSNTSAEGVVHTTISNLCRQRPHTHQLYNSFARQQKGNAPANRLARIRTQAADKTVWDFVSQLIETDKTRNSTLRKVLSFEISRD